MTKLSFCSVFAIFLLWNEQTCSSFIVPHESRRQRCRSLTHISIRSSKRNDDGEILSENNIKEDDPARRKMFVRGGISTAAAMFSSNFLLGRNEYGYVANALNYDQSELSRINVFEKTSPSVVFLDTFVERRDAFSTNVMEVPLGTGSGFVWDLDGHIVTNYHVVRNAKSAQVAIMMPKGSRNNQNKTPKMGNSTASLSNSNETELVPYTAMRSSDSSNGPDQKLTTIYKATVVGVDPTKDIAVLKVDVPKKCLVPISVGKSTGIRVGQNCLAIGNPFGLDHTLTAGIISGLGREVKSPIGRPISNVIQTDAAINPGNSGGPLLDMAGKVIGMNTAIFSPTGASAGIGFAIPIDTVKIIVEALIRDGKIVRPMLGISYLESRQARALGITNGVLILDVPGGSPASEAGLKGTRRTEAGLIELGDIITKINTNKINSETDLFKALDERKPEEVIEIGISRVGTVDGEVKLVELVVKLKLQPSTDLEKYSFEPRNTPQRSP